MSPKLSYSFTILRYTHDVLSGECLNVGILMVTPKARSLLVRTRKRQIGRIRQTFPDIDRQAFVDSIRAVEREAFAIQQDLKEGDLLNEYPDALAVARKIMVHDDSSLQWSDLFCGLTHNLEETFSWLYERYVSRYDVNLTPRRDDEDVWQTVKSKLDEKNVSVELTQKCIVSHSDELVLKKAWKNGLWHAYEALSFDLANADHIKDKARKWRGHLEAVHTGQQEELQLHFVVGPPQDKSLLTAYEHAVRILGDAAFHPKIYEEKDADILVSEIEDEWAQHMSSIAN